MCFLPAEMPFARKEGTITMGQENLGQRCDTIAQIAFIAWLASLVRCDGFEHLAKTRHAAVGAGDQHCTRDRA
jgi:hypothetical protein